MTSLSDVAAMVRRHGAVLVSPELLGADGAATMRPGPQLVADLFVNAVGLVYQAEGGRAHWLTGSRVVRDGSSLVVLGVLRYSRLVIEPPRTAERQLRVAELRGRGAAALPLLREMLDDLRASRSTGRRCGGPLREFRASWHARLNGAGLLDTCGAAVLGARRLVYASLDGGAMRDLRADFAAAQRAQPAADLFTYLVESGNGQTNEWSRPFALAAPFIEVAAARVVTRLRFRDDLAGHLRELWLAAHLGATQDAVTEAEAIIDGRGLDAPARDYLARLRALANEKRTGRAPACRGGTRGRRTTGRSRGGREDAP